MFGIPGTKKTQKPPGLNRMTLMSIVIILGMAYLVAIVNNANTPAEVEGLEIHFIDVGQGDCILALAGTSALLIDGGESDQAQKVMEYLKQKRIGKLDYVIATNQNSRYIGALPAILETFEAGVIIMPGAIHTTEAYETLLQAVSGKGSKTNPPEPGTAYLLGDAVVEIIGCFNGDDLGDFSTVVRLTYGDTAFLFMSGAGKQAEADMLGSGRKISAKLIKLGRHGAGTATSEAFIEAAAPDGVVITAGADNDDGCPDESVLSILSQAGIKVFRTDLNGSIIVRTDGEKVEAATERQ